MQFIKEGRVACPSKYRTITINYLTKNNSGVILNVYRYLYYITNIQISIRTDEIQDIQVFVVIVFHSIKFYTKILFRIYSHNFTRFYDSSNFL